MGHQRGLRWVATAGACALVLAMIVGGHYLGRMSFDDHRAMPAASPSPSTADTTAEPRSEPVHTFAPAAAPQAVPPEAATVADPRTVKGPYGSNQLTGTPSVALTFDDGPDPVWTPRVLDLLREYGIHATFCVIGANVRAFPALVTRIAREGHTMCNHTWGHNMDLGSWSPEEIRSNLQRTNDEIHRAAPGVPIPYFRQPGGFWTPLGIQVAAQLGMASIHWDVDPQDWSRPGAGVIARTVDGGTRPGSIVLLHDGGGDRSGTLAACRVVLPYLRARFRLTALPVPHTYEHSRGYHRAPS
ncbi:MAG TPA: polysaccharide deacetylase family protein [Micromonosporaceae bacterium]|nr:polysaccharide deacetylase family protein [Micromonosporaceae bacterium]